MSADPNSNSNNREKSVLIMEDDLILTLSLEVMLKNIGVGIIERVETGEGAVENALEGDFDLILADIYLGAGISGIEAVRQIQAEKSISVIYITGNSDQQNKTLAGNTEYQNYLIKPISRGMLRSAIEEIWPEFAEPEKE